MCDWAVSKMKKKNQLNKVDKITPYTKENLESMLSSNNVNIENLAAGVYMFKVTSNQGTATSKVIKQ